MIKKVCKKCKVEFETNKHDKEYCNSKSCRKLNVKATVEKEQIINYCGTLCPYCSKHKFKSFNSLKHHLKSHFGYTCNIHEICDYVLDKVWGYKKPKCINNQCSNYTEIQKIDPSPIYTDLCKTCKSIFYKDRIEYFEKKYGEDYEEFKLKRLKKTSDTYKKNIVKNSESNRRALSISKEKRSEALKRFFRSERGKEQIKKNSEKTSKKLKEKILSGEFTPCITNTRTHWNAKIIFETGVEKKFRSSWEACFWFSNQHLEFEKIRIKYFDSKGKERITITDFVDIENRIIYELKPKSRWELENDKIQSVINYCLSNDYKFIWINEDNILNYIFIERYTILENKLQLIKLLKGIRRYDLLEKITNN